MSTRIGIIGVGAIGSVVGGLLTKAGHDVTLIDQWPDHVEAMKKVGLRLSGTCGEHLIPVRALLIHELQSVAEPFDAVFISVKSYDTEWALALGLSYLKKPDGIIVDFATGAWDASSPSGPACTSRATPSAPTGVRSASRSASTTAP